MESAVSLCQPAIMPVLLSRRCLLASLRGAKTAYPVDGKTVDAVRLNDYL